MIIISKEELIRQINMCKDQIHDLEKNLEELNVESKKLKSMQDETHSDINRIKKEVRALKSELFNLEKKENLTRKQII